MRLTLRTLLAYLDDTLDPTEIKQIGQKVAESDAAQELIARLKQVTRRRRLTTPPITGPGASKFDPNTVAEYLDNVLANDQLAEVERLCLESDVHLAEIAACHQILTLVLGEPALVPPTARKRMYTLVRGREANPYRRPPAQPARHKGEEEHPRPEMEGDDALLMGLPFYAGKTNWLQWALPLTAILLLGALGLAIYSAMPPASTRTVAQMPEKATRPETAADVKDTRTEGKETRPEVKDTRPEVRDTKPEVKETKKEEKPRPVDPDAGKERREVAHVATAGKQLPNLLLQRKKGQEEWTRLALEKPIFTSDTLLALPGYRSLLKFDSGADLLLWGNLPEFLDMVPLLEAAVVLHNNPDADLDFTLERGRAVIANRKPAGSLKARVRFNEEPGKEPEIWEVVLEPGAEVALDLIGRYARETAYNSGEGPLQLLALVTLEGQTTVKADGRTFTTPADGPSIMVWDNKGPGVQRPQKLDPKNLQPWNKALPSTAQANAAKRALDELIVRPPNKPMEVMLSETLDSDNPVARSQAVFCLGALDAVPKVLDCLVDPDDRHFEVRDAAIITLRQWIGRNIEQDKKLYTLLTEQKKYKERQAVTVMQLLHDFQDKQLMQPETWEFLIFCINDEKQAIRELAYWHLVRLMPGVRGMAKFYPGSDSKQRETAYAAWKMLVPEGKVPNMGGGGTGGPMPPK